MLRLENPPSEFDSYVVFGKNVDQRLGDVGEVGLVLHPRQTDHRPVLVKHTELLQVLGKEITCKEGDWTFVGVAERCEYLVEGGAFSIIVRDALSKLSNSFNSRVYANCNFSDIAAEIVPDGECLGDCGNIPIRLAIQYNESDLDFVQRVLNEHGHQIWCTGGKIYMGATPCGDESTARLGRDIQDYSIVTELGPEDLTVTSYQYTQADRPENVNASLDGGSDSDLESAAIDVRRNSQSSQTLHLVEEESLQAAEDFGQRWLRMWAAGRFRLVGEAPHPYELGSSLKIKSAGTGDESGTDVELRCLVREVTASGLDADGASSYRVEVANMEAFLPDAGVAPGRLFKSQAIVSQTHDDLNRVKVYFPWDPNETETPWLRAVSSSWGDSHMQYIPHNIGDTVVVMWGQYEMDPLVVGATSGGDPVDLPEDITLIRTVDGHSITIVEDNIKILNEMNGGNTSIEILPDQVKVTAQNGEAVTMGGGGLVLDDGQGASIEIKGGNITITGNMIDIKGNSQLTMSAPMTKAESGSGGTVMISGPSVNMNNGALEVI